MINSRFINEPFKNLEKCLGRFNFFPMEQQRVSDLQKMLQKSRILKKENINADLMIEVIPEGLIKMQLIY